MKIQFSFLEKVYVIYDLNSGGLSECTVLKERFAKGTVNCGLSVFPIFNQHIAIQYFTDSWVGNVITEIQIAMKKLSGWVTN